MKEAEKFKDVYNSWLEGGPVAGNDEDGWAGGGEMPSLARERGR